MKQRGLHYLLGFLSFIAALGMACETLLPSATATPAPTLAPTSGSGSSNNTKFVTFTDKNNNYQIEVPADWTHKTTTGDGFYWDTFTSPDKGAVVENYTYLNATSSDGKPWGSDQQRKQAQLVLDADYSKTGKPGDIDVAAEQPQGDGSVRLAWESKAGGYEGVSYYEMRGTSFLLFTLNWGSGQGDTYLDTLNQVIASYRVP